MPKWIELEAQEYLRRGTVDADVHIEIAVSPYDIPEAVRGYRDQSGGRFVIEFRYMTTEDEERKRENEFTFVRIGKRTGRLYAIEFDLTAAGLQEIEGIYLRVRAPDIAGRSIELLEQEPGREHRRENYRVARDVIFNEQNEIFSNLTA